MAYSWPNRGLICTPPGHSRSLCKRVREILPGRRALPPNPPPLSPRALSKTFPRLFQDLSKTIPASDRPPPPLPLAPQ
eukprot:7377774-Prymnesium_polylepis.1